MGRYKFNKKLSIARRITGHQLAMPITDPLTGEIIADAGEILSLHRSEEIEARGVNEAVLIGPEGKNVKVFGNGMVDIKPFVDFDPEDLGIR